MADTRLESPVPTKESNDSMDGQIEEILMSAKKKLAEITNIATESSRAKIQITEDQEVIATKLDNIHKAQENADKVGADLDRALTAATQEATAAEAQNSKAKLAADDAAKLITDIQTVKGSVETDAVAVATARGTAEKSATTTKDLADVSTDVKDRITSYENRLVELVKTIEALLPGATSAGLAHAFDERRKTFLKPHNLWQGVFVSSVLVIAGLAATGMWSLYGAATPPTYDDLVLGWVTRLFVAVPLIWLALHASREAALSKRLEEDYGYKSATASCLEGFKKQMSEVGKDVATDSPLAKLLDNTLTTIATPPGRIYDKHKLTVTPSGELNKVAQIGTEILKTSKAGS